MAIIDPGLEHIGDHALLGDGRAHALVTSHGTIDWLSLPEDAGLVLFDALLDAAAGGRFSLGTTEDATCSQRYLPGSMVLETTHETRRGSLVVTDCFTLHNGAMLPWVELVRSVHCRRGTVGLRWSVEPNLVLGGTPTSFTARHGYLQVDHGPLRVGMLHWDAGDPSPTSRGVSATRTLVAGDDALLALVAVVGEPLPRPDRGEVESRIARTVQTWRTWDEGIEYQGRWADQVRHSARILKLLTHEPDGAIMAAPTTSLPERLGGDRNYDYRYCWIRDASFTVDALLRIGLVEEAHRAITALLRMAATTAPHLAPFYEIGGSVPDESREVDLPGFRASRPVRSGNEAAGQLQLGNWGDLFEALWIYVRQGNDLDPGTARLVRDLADHVCDRWREPDSGIWELPVQHHYTISKMGCWVALERAGRMVAAGQVVGDVQRWLAARDAIRAFVDEYCWSQQKQSFTFHDETDGLDAATLLAARTGYVDGNSEQMRGTIEAVRHELGDGPFVWRYAGQRDHEGAFVACSFWLAEALVRSGRLHDAAEVFDGALAAMTPLGLLSEQYDPRSDDLLGNHPQGLSHLALVNAASFFTEASERVGADDGE